MIPKESNSGLVTLVLTTPEAVSPAKLISDFGVVVRSCVNSTPQLERSQADRATKAVITILKVLVNVFFTGLSFTTKFQLVVFNNYET